MVHPRTVLEWKWVPGESSQFEAIASRGQNVGLSDEYSDVFLNFYTLTQTFLWISRFVFIFRCSISTK